MNATQKVEIIEVIKGDCKIRRRYIDRDGCTCAIGALAMHKGLPIPSWNSNNVSDFIRSLPLAAQLCEAYGLNEYQLQEIQDRNDAGDTQAVRQQSILDYVNGMAVTP